MGTFPGRRKEPWLLPLSDCHPQLPLVPFGVGRTRRENLEVIEQREPLLTVSQQLDFSFPEGWE